MHFIALFQSVIWPLKVGDNPTLIASLGISNESCPLQDLESGLGGHEQACTKEEEDNVAHGRGGQCLPRGSWRASGWPTIEEPSRTGPEMEDDVSPGSSSYSSESEAGKNRGGQPCRGRRNNNNVFKYFFQSSFNCLSLLQSVSTGAASFKPLSSNLSFTVSKTPSLSPPNTACASKFVQKSANYDCGDKNVKLYINWCIIFGLDLCYTFSKHEMHSYCHKM